jgi:hypothetical protein
MKCLAGDKSMMHVWMHPIEQCVRSNGNDCAAIKGTVNVDKKN